MNKNQMLSISPQVSFEQKVPPTLIVSYFFEVSKVNLESMNSLICQHHVFFYFFGFFYLRVKYNYKIIKYFWQHFLE